MQFLNELAGFDKKDQSFDEDDYDNDGDVQNPEFVLSWCESVWDEFVLFTSRI